MVDGELLVWLLVLLLVGEQTWFHLSHFPHVCGNYDSRNFVATFDDKIEKKIKKWRLLDFKIIENDSEEQ